jgi:hypothetical protein
MRIISKFKDYYDGALAFGQDKSVVFVRNDESVDAKQKGNEILSSVVPKFSINTKRKKDTWIAFAPVMVVFCGKLYRGMMCKRKTVLPFVKGEFPKPDEHEVKVFYDIAELEEYLALYEMKVPEEKRYYWQTDRNSDNVKAFLSAQGTPELSEYCIAHRYVTLAYFEDFSVEYGPLAKTQFYKILDPFAAYQELDMFISGTLPQSTAMPIQIEDKYRIAQHGFDKYSFRKPPSK